jgi:hypothetical protein
LSAKLLKYCAFCSNLLLSSSSKVSYSRLSVQTRPQNFKVENVYNQYGYLMAKRAPKAQITDYDREYLSKLLELVASFV